MKRHLAIPGRDPRWRRSYCARGTHPAPADAVLLAERLPPDGICSRCWDDARQMAFSRRREVSETERRLDIAASILALLGLPHVADMREKLADHLRSLGV